MKVAFKKKFRKSLLVGCTAVAAVRASILMLQESCKMLCYDCKLFAEFK